MLHRREDFEPLVDEAWNEERVRAGIAEIVAGTEAELRGPKLLWRANDWDRWRATSPLKDLYCGAAGVLWALADLRERGHAETGLDLADLALHGLERQRARPDLGSWTDLPEPRESSLLAGEAGVLLVAFRLTRDPRLADSLLTRVRENVANEADEVMWGAPGSLIAARWMLDWTGDPRWRSAWDVLAKALLGRQDADGQWTQRLHGHTTRYLGPPHGLVGNVQSLAPLLDDERRAALEGSARTFLARSAFVEDGHANWPPEKRDRLESPSGEIRLQWCHGAPGIVCSAAAYLDEELLVAAAELVWAAGAHRDAKGASICHGTAGNGYALLATFARTGDERWLERARRFAVHALVQARRLRDAEGRGRHSLWTGDLGVARFAADCLEARSVYPVLDAGLDSRP